MNERVDRALSAAKNFPSLAQLERNVRDRLTFDDAVEATFKRRAEVLARELIIKRTGLDLNDLTPAEERIVRAVCEYVAIKKRVGSDATRTLNHCVTEALSSRQRDQCRSRSQRKAFRALHEEDLGELSYEQIVLEHPEEFSPRALWYARRTLGRPNPTDKPPARKSIPAQIRTEELLSWLSERASHNDGLIEPFSNAQAAAALGMTDMSRQGRVYGNIQSRLDFACYRLESVP